MIATVRGRDTEPDPDAGAVVLPPMTVAQVVAMIDVLDRHKVEYLLIGGMAAQLQGVPIEVTRDADLNVNATDANLGRLVAALRELGAKIRIEGQPGRADRPRQRGRGEPDRPWRVPARTDQGRSGTRPGHRADRPPRLSTLPAAGASNSRNGTTPKTVATEVGDVALDVPRDRHGTFEPRLVPKGQRRLGGLDEQIISLYTGGMTVRDIQHHLARARWVPS